ncbi:putative inorganic phosphate cotransporter isoform X3 [Convolutriloba macropyga]|uniref:putative inorganic phosphate cotransporter isoform X3 n=1 Tax=Convolutriloba macropyga TaxID=536237 RepID=UPI003F522C27
MVLKIVNKNRQFTTYSCNLSVIFVHKCCPNMEIEAEEQKNLLPQNASQYPKTFHEKFFSTRYRIAFLGFLGFASIFTMRVTMSIAIVEMVTDQGTRDGSYNENCPASENVKLANTAAGTFDWTTNQQAHILAAPFYGYLASQLPGGFLASSCNLLLWVLLRGLILQQFEYGSLFCRNSCSNWKHGWICAWIWDADCN